MQRIGAIVQLGQNASRASRALQRDEDDRCIENAQHAQHAQPRPCSSIVRELRELEKIIAQSVGLSTLSTTTKGIVYSKPNAERTEESLDL